MRLFKFFLILSILTPVSLKNDFYSNLEYAFFTAKIKPVDVKLQNWNDKVQFYLNNTKVILSTQKNPYWQITSLQQTLNIGKIRNKEIKFIDLSIDHPYATFKNN